MPLGLGEEGLEAGPDPLGQEVNQRLVVVPERLEQPPHGVLAALPVELPAASCRRNWNQT